MENLGTFINLMTDFGFKRVFGSVEFKSILIRFLNVLFSKEGVEVNDVMFHDKEVLPPDSDGKRIVYDVYCTSLGHRGHFILEMQQLYHADFEKRAMYYLAKAVSSQGIRGSKYDYIPVYGIFFVDFQLSHLQRRLLHNFQMMESQTHEIFSNIMRLMIVCLKEAKPSWDECTTDLEKTTFLLKNMHLMDKNSKAYMSGEYYDMFEAAEIGSLAAEDVVAYSQSKRAFDDRILYREAALEEGEKHGFERGRMEGRMEGLIEGKEAGWKEACEEKAAMMLKAGIDPELVKQIMGVPPYEC